MPDIRLEKISQIIRELRSLEATGSAERIKILGCHGRVIENGIDVTDSLLVGHYMGKIRTISELIQDDSSS